MKFKMIPVKNQKFEIGRTINFTKCDCKECNFMSCPKNNYCLKMTQKKYTVKEFFSENKEDMLKYSSLYKCARKTSTKNTKKTRTIRKFIHGE